jgi:cyclohexa-1,5-dienecarbonyl-CoA hydratase
VLRGGGAVIGSAPAGSIRSERAADGRVARLVLDFGKGNVIGTGEIDALRAAVRALGSERSLTGLILDHAGPHFSFGASVPEHLPGKVERMLPALHALAHDLLALDLYTVAAVRGACLGGGMELALLADRIVVAPGVKLGQPEVQLGVFAPIGSALLPRRVGATRAAELLVTGRTIGASAALAIGLAQEIADDPGAAAEAWVAEHLAPKSAAALRLAVHAVRRAWVPDFLDDLRTLEELYLSTLMYTRDAREGLEAFLAKRPPVWEDR